MTEIEMSQTVADVKSSDVVEKQSGEPETAGAVSKTAEPLTGDYPQMLIYRMIYQNRIKNKEQIKKALDVTSKTGCMTEMVFVISLGFVPYLFDRFQDVFLGFTVYDHYVPVHPFIVLPVLMFVLAIVNTIQNFIAVRIIAIEHKCPSCGGELAFYYNKTIVKKDDPVVDEKIYWTNCPFETKHVYTMTQKQDTYDVWDCYDCDNEEERLKESENVILSVKTKFTCDNCGAINTIDVVDSGKEVLDRRISRSTEKDNYGSETRGERTISWHDEYVKCEEWEYYCYWKTYECSHCGKKQTVRDEQESELINSWEEDRHRVRDD